MLNPGEVHEEILVPEYFGAVLIGPKGETAAEIRTQSGIRLLQVASSNAPNDKIVHLVGKEEAVCRAKTLINELLDSALHDTMLIPADKSGLVVGISGETIRSIKAKTVVIKARTGLKYLSFNVAENHFEGPKTLHLAGGRAEIDAAKREVDALINGTPYQVRDCVSGRVAESMLVPAAACRSVIGKGGETIGKLMADSGAFMYLMQQNSAEPGDKPLQIHGTQESVERAKRLVQQLIDNVTPHAMLREELLIEPGLAGKVIGMGGETIKSIKNQTGVVKIYVESPEQSAERGFFGQQILHIVGSESSIENAKAVVNDIFTRSHLPLPRTISVIKGPQALAQPSTVTLGIPVPREIVSLIMGRSADVFRVVLESTGARLRFDVNELMGQSSVLSATVTGREEQCRQAMDHIGRLMQSHAYLIGHQNGPLMLPIIGPTNLPAPHACPQEGMALRGNGTSMTPGTSNSIENCADISTSAVSSIEEPVRAQNIDAVSSPPPAVPSPEPSLMPRPEARTRSDAPSPTLTATNANAESVESCNPPLSAGHHSSSVQRETEEEQARRDGPTRKRAKISTTIIECITIDDD